MAAVDRSQRQHEAARRALEAAAPPGSLSPFVLAEIDHLLAMRVSQDAERLIGRHRDLAIGLADA